MSVREFNKEITLDMSVSVEQAEQEWYDLADCLYAPMVTAYRERFEALKIQAQTGKPAPPIRYIPKSREIVDVVVDADTELRFPRRRVPPKPAASPVPPVPPVPPVSVPPVSPPQLESPIIEKENPMPSAPSQSHIVIIDRLKQARQQAGWTASQLDHALKLPGRTVYEAERGRVRKHVDEIAKFLHIRPEWLETGEGEMFASEPPRPTVQLPKGGVQRKERIETERGYKRKLTLVLQAQETAEIQTAKLALDPAGERVVSIAGPLVLSQSELERVQKWFGLQFIVQ